jgi:hypothetical protein
LITKETLEGFGDFKTGGQVIRTVKYADDLVLLAKGETVLQGMIDRLSEIGRRYGMEKKLEKTKVMRISRQPFFSYGSTAPRVPKPPRFSITHSRHTILDRNPLDEGPVRRRDLYLTTHNTHNRQTSMPSAGFKPTIPVNERPQTKATGIGNPR